MLKIEDFEFNFENPNSEPLIQIYEHFLELRNLNIGSFDFKVDDLEKIPKQEWFDILSRLIEIYGYENYLQHLRFNLEGITKLQAGYNIVKRRIKIDERKGIRSYFWDHVDNPTNKKIYLDAPTHYYFYSSDKSRILKGLILSVACIPDPTILITIEKFAIECPFQVGSVSQAPTGLYVYDVLEVFSKISYPFSVQHIMNLKSRINQTWAQKRFDKYIAQIAKKQKVDLDKVIEIAISDYGFDNLNCFSKDLGNYLFRLSYKSGLKDETIWIDKVSNKTQKAVPKEIRDDQPEILKQIKTHLKDIENQIKTQLNRIEKLYYSDCSWDNDYWLRRYVQHPFIGIIAKEFYWTLSLNDTNIIAKIDENSQLTNVGGETFNPTEYTKVRLWHPLHNTIGESPQESNQPFKQSKREVYTAKDLLTLDGKVLRRDILSQLCKSRNWTSSANHNFDIPGSDIKVALVVEDIMDGARTLGYTSANIIFRGIQFKSKKDDIDISKINPITLSEIIRDVYLFTAKSELKDE
ncbi:MAG TPA: DUF4132 domain-containing protein [Saprospiraceae bacterium]|jgi:hypothetical protein|nr:DUF4132 domain-containing protein [Saprospiraceae bacterium]